MSHFKSADIAFFPSAIIRGGDITKSHKITDSALQNLIKSLVDINKFVVDWNGTNCTCFINGCVFLLTGVTTYASTADTDIYVTPTFDDGTLKGTDELIESTGTYYFDGVDITFEEDSTNLSSSPDSMCLHILHRATPQSSWEVPTESLHKFKSDSIKNIDGGVV